MTVWMETATGQAFLATGLSYASADQLVRNLSEELGVKVWAEEE